MSDLKVKVVEGKSRFGIPIGGVCSHRCEFCAICNGQPLKTRAEERLIRAALAWNEASIYSVRNAALRAAIRFVQRERARERSKP